MSADFDKAIDHAVREMLDVEPPAGLRRRVIERLGHDSVASSFSWKIALPIAAAAVLLLALLLPRSTPQQPETTTVQTQQPVTAPVTPRPMQPSAPEAPLPQPVPQAVPERRVVAASTPADVTFDAPPAPGFPRLPALSVPELSVSSIQRVAPVEGPNAIAPDPIATPSPLAIEPLPADGRQSQE
jgi:hypothetical protein